METMRLILTTDSYEQLRIMFERDCQFRAVVAGLRATRIKPHIRKYTFTYAPVTERLTLGVPTPVDTEVVTEAHRIRLVKTPENLWRIEYCPSNR